MFGEKKTRSKEAKWMVTFADLITLLFCFFVYLSLFNKPQVDLKTGFIVSEKTISNLTDRLPENIVKLEAGLDNLRIRKEDVVRNQQFELALEAILREWSHHPRLDGNRVFCSDVQQPVFHICDSGRI
jgi:flagellar motor protein MotB